MTLLVAGGCGFIGRQLVELLSSTGRLATVLATPECVRGVRRIPPGVDAVILVDDGDLFDGPRREQPGWAAGLARQAAESGVASLVFASSTLVYPGGARSIDDRTLPEPGSPYGRSKLCAEIELARLGEATGMKVASVRLPHVYGWGSALFEYVSLGALPFAGDPDAVFSHLHVEDAATALIAAADIGLDGVAAVADSFPTTWREFFTAVRRHRPEFQVDSVDPQSRDRALRLLGWSALPLPSAITPGTGFGCRLDQRIDPSASWERLGVLPRHADFQSGIDDVFLGCPRQPRPGRDSAGPEPVQSSVWVAAAQGIDPGQMKSGSVDVMELKVGALVRTADGEGIGRIDRFIVDPSTSIVSHLVLKKGVLFPEERVLLVDAIDHVDGDGPVVSSDVSADSLPPYEKTHYVEVDDVTRSRVDSRLGAAVMWRLPTHAGGLYAMFPEPRDRAGTVERGTEVERTEVPGSGVVLDDDTPVVGVDGEEVGKVLDMVVDADGRLSHLVVDLGLLSGERILPAHWIQSLRRDQVTVAVGQAALAGLEEDRGRS